MESLFSNTIANIILIILVGVLLTPLMRYMRPVRVLIALYIAFLLTMILPDGLVSGEYAPVIFFSVTVILVGITFSRLCSVERSWFGGYFDIYMCMSSIFMVIFLIAIMCSIIPLAVMQDWIAQDVIDLLVENIFYVAIISLIYHVLFSKHLR